MSIENEQLREKLEAKYNINLNISDNEGRKTYEDLIEYFTKEIEQDNLLISTIYATMCCMRTDIKAMKEDFNEQLTEFTQYQGDEVCEDPYIEGVRGERCQYAANSSSNL
jgi:hypothetical protein